MYKDDNLNISIGIVALNEEKNLPSLLKDIVNQTYDKSKIELIFVDSESDDATYKIFCYFKTNYIKIFKDIKIYKNKRKIQSAGWNLVISNYCGDALIRLDAHSRIPNNFVESNVFYINKGEKVVGGVRPTMISNDSNWNKTLLLAEESMFGSSIANYRRSDEERYVKSMFHACYTKEVVTNIGFFNEYLGRTEDNEYHFRIRAMQYRLYYNSKIKSYQIIRCNLKKMLKQKYGNGLWIGRTLSVCPKCLSIYHFIPLCFVLVLFMSIIIMIIKNDFFFITLVSLYVLFDLMNTMLCFINKNANITTVMLIFIFPLLHITYGIGTLIGIMSIPFWKQRGLAKFRIRRS